MRTPRRSFASPFIVTLATIPACYTGSTPAPAPQPTTATAPIAASPAPAPAPAPASRTATWFIQQQGTTCTAMETIQCPQGATCNPPPPTSYPCPADIPLPVTISTYDTGCAILPALIHCPPNAMCNQPPPRKVPCPS